MIRFWSRTTWVSYCHQWCWPCGCGKWHLGYQKLIICSGIINQSLWLVCIGNFLYSEREWPCKCPSTCCMCSFWLIAFVKGNKVLVKEAMVNSVHMAFVDSPRKVVRQAAEQSSMLQMTVHKILRIQVSCEVTNTSCATCNSQGQRNLLHIFLYHSRLRL